MSRYGFALSRGWMAAHLALAGVVALLVSLGMWQLGRLDARRSYNRLVAERLALPPVRDLPPSGSDAAYRRVTVEGEFDAARQARLFGRALRGRPGYHVLTPLRTPGAPDVVVDRGWMPFESAAPRPQSGTVRLEGVLFPSERTGGEAGGRGGRVLSRLDVSAFRAPGRPVYPMYLLARSVSPAPGPADPVPAPLPELTEGPHANYAGQWFLFAVVAVAGYAALLRRAARDRERAPPAVGGAR